jgi:hypothetical protein
VADFASIGGPSQVPIVKSPRSQKECVNPNYFQNIETCTDEETHHCSRHFRRRIHRCRRNYCQQYHSNYVQLQQWGLVVAQGNVIIVPLRSPIVSATAVGLAALDNLRLRVPRAKRRVIHMLRTIEPLPPLSINNQPQTQ